MNEYTATLLGGKIVTVIVGGEKIKGVVNGHVYGQPLKINIEGWTVRLDRIDAWRVEDA